MDASPGRTAEEVIAAGVGSVAGWGLTYAAVRLVGEALDLGSREGPLRELEGAATTLGAAVVAAGIGVGCWAVLTLRRHPDPARTGLLAVGVFVVLLFGVVTVGPDRPGTVAMAASAAAAGAFARLLTRPSRRPAE